MAQGLRWLLAAGAGLVLLHLAGAAAGTTWEDRQVEAGISFVHTGSGPDNTPNFVEVVASGACWGDLDDDGHPDAYLVNQLYFNASENAMKKPTSRVFLNNGDGTFLDASLATRADHAGWGTGCSLADFDGDFDLDLLVTGYDNYTLYRNEGGASFTALHDSGITARGKCGEKRCWGAGSAWADYDRDGDLDAYVTNYVDFDLEEGGIIGPEFYNGQTNLLFRNDGGGRFTDVTAEANASGDPGPNHNKAFQPVWFDHDRDGWLDIYITSDGTPNSLQHNQRNGTFRNIAVEAGVDDPLSGMGLDIADEGGDGWPDLYFTHFELQNNGFYVSRGDGTYRDRSGEGELGEDWDLVGWGTGFHDLDHDGDIDIYATNGHVFPDVGVYGQPTLLFLQQPDGSYVNATDEAGTSFLARSVGRGSAVADYDADGDLDILQNNADDGEARLFQANNVTGRWLQVELRSAGPNTRGIGAWVVAELPSGRELHRLVKAGNSFLSQDWDTLHFGLGEAAGIAALEVRWPSGQVQRWGPVAADQRVQVWEGDPGIRNDTLPPRTTLAAEGPRGPLGWFTGPATVTISAEDRGIRHVSGVASTEFRVDRGPWAPAGEPLRFSAPGIHLVEARSADRSGNVEGVRRLEVRLDPDPPRTEMHRLGPVGREGWHTAPVALFFTATDGLSGVEGTFVRVDGGGWRPAEPLVLGAGEHLVEYFSLDVAGNFEDPRSEVVRVDPRPPRLAPAPAAAGPWPGSEAVAAVWDEDSGVAAAAFFLGDEAEPRHVAGPEGGLVRWPLDGQDIAPGVHRLRVVVWDRAGHAAEAESVLVAVPAAPMPAGNAGPGPRPGLDDLAPPLALAVEARRRTGAP